MIKALREIIRCVVLATIFTLGLFAVSSIVMYLIW
jgi:hypothetical protein